MEEPGRTDQSVAVPLCIDCDGTLIRTDLLHEAVFLLFKKSPLKMLCLPFWLLHGKAHVKDKLARLVEFDWSTVPVNEQVVALVRSARESGRKVVLATASHRLFAEGIARHLGLFDEVLATEGAVNLAGARKRAELLARYGENGFDYVGNDRNDLPVWSIARRATVVSSSSPLIEAVRRTAKTERVIPVPGPGWMTYIRALRLHQWLKNLLVLVPLLAAHQWSSVDGWWHSGLAFLAFSLCASAVYILNDLLDLDSDRRHVRKRHRPFAAALIPVWQGSIMIPLLLVAAFGISVQLPLQFTGVLLTYFLLTLSYSLLLKRQVVVDVLLLAGLYTLRVIAGSAATAIAPSFWLLAFSMFIFLSLAMVKRYSELMVTLQQKKDTTAGRGYSVLDLPVLMSTGTSSGMVSVLVLAFYINNPDINGLYPNPWWIWLIPPLLLYWISRLWMKSHRGEIDDDPVVFAVRDWQSLLVLALSACMFALASL